MTAKLIIIFLLHNRKWWAHNGLTVPTKNLSLIPSWEFFRVDIDDEIRLD